MNKSVFVCPQNRCKIFAESKLLSAVTVLTRDKNSDFSKIKYLIINKLIFKKRQWKVPYFPHTKKATR